MPKSWPGRRRYVNGLKTLPYKASDARLADVWGVATASLMRSQLKFDLGVYGLADTSPSTIEHYAIKAGLHGRRAIRQGRTA